MAVRAARATKTAGAAGPAKSLSPGRRGGGGSLFESPSRRRRRRGEAAAAAVAAAGGITHSAAMAHEAGITHSAVKRGAVELLTMAKAELRREQLREQGERRPLARTLELGRAGGGGRGGGLQPPPFGIA